MTNVDDIVKLADTFCVLAEDKKKVDPKAAVRSRGDAVFPYTHPKVKDKKTHFPITDANQARNALARAMQYRSVPSWYSGSLKSLQDAVRKKVHSKYPGIEITKKKKSNIETNIEKVAILKHEVDLYIDRVIHQMLSLSKANVKNLHQLQIIKSKFSVGFDPELEDVVVEVMPAMETRVVECMKSMQDVHNHLNALLRRVGETSALK